MSDLPVIEVKDEEEIVPDATGKHPETVPWNKYVGIKQSLGNKLAKAHEKVSSLEEQVKTAIKPEEHLKLKSELDEAKAKAETMTKELNTIKEQTTAEKRNFLISKGVQKEKADTLNGDALNAAVMVLEGTVASKPKPDLGGGGGAHSLSGTPTELARQAYTTSPKSK